MKLVLIASLLALSGYAGCVAVSSDRILAGELSATVPFLKALDPGTLIGFAPRPGTQRVLPARELALIAEKHGIALSEGAVSSVCVERVMRRIPPEEMRAALLAAIGVDGVDLELIDYSREPLPPGRLEFRPTQLHPAAGNEPQAPVTWRGLLHYDARSTMPVWACLKVSQACTILVASEDIAAGTVVRAEQVKEVPGRRFPFAAPSLGSLEAIAGKQARRRIARGQPFVAGALEEPKEINRGDQVQVSVIDGLATLSLEATAESAGRKGESIVVRNPATGKSFRAVVEQKGKVIVKSSTGA
jgi:flagella basal body P-ring formation protein FlgA